MSLHPELLLLLRPLRCPTLCQGRTVGKSKNDLSLAGGISLPVFPERLKMGRHLTQAANLLL